MILKAYPAAAKETNIQGFLPLQSCMRHKIQDTDLLVEVLLAHPETTKIPDEYGRTVLHYACSRNMDLRYIRCLLEQYPSGAQVSDRNDQLPLHQAVIRGDRMELIELLLHYHANAVLAVDRYWMVPMNYAVEVDAPMGTVYALLGANPLAAHHCMQQTKTVLHHAVEFKRCTAMIGAIVHAYPGATRIQEPQLGRLPLHWAIERLLPVDTLTAIDDANPVDGALVTDTRGWRSIHYAIHYPTPAVVVQRILRANPKVAQVKDDFLHLEYFHDLRSRAENSDFPPPVPADAEAYLLLHYAVAHNALPETVAEILLYTMPYSAHDGAFNANHYDTWCYIMAHCGDRYWRSVDIVLTHYEHQQHIINLLSEFRDQTARRVIDIASPRSMHEVLRRMYFFSRYEVHNMLSIHKSKYNLLQSAMYHSGNDGSGGNKTTNTTAVKSTAAGAGVVAGEAGVGVGGYDNSNGLETEYVSSSKPAVLKFTSQRSRFIREVIVRTRSQVSLLSPQYVLELLNYHNAQEDPSYRAEIELKGYLEYPFLLVLKQVTFIEFVCHLSD
jgi:hypothetical protein